MIGLRTLSLLNSQRQKDARTLFNGNRYAAAVYLMGYAIEYALKRKICFNLGFNLGFTEYNSVVEHYRAQLADFNAVNNGARLSQLRQIKNHKLDELLLFSGIEDKIDNHYKDWLVVQGWNPEDRYKIRRYSPEKCRNFMTSARTILTQTK